MHQNAPTPPPATGRPAIEFRSAYDQGFARVAAVTLPVTLADPAANAAAVIARARRLGEEGVCLAVFPELGLTGYSIDDLLLSDVLLRETLAAIETIRAASAGFLPAIVVGAPLRVGGRLFNCAVVIAGGAVRGAAPKSYPPAYREFYEKRHFACGGDAGESDIDVNGARVPFGTDLLFEVDDVPGLVFHAEVCEDMWVPVPPSSLAALAGATVLVNLSGSPVTVGRAEDRELLVRASSSRGLAAYVFAAAGQGESSTDLAWDGQTLVYENGEPLGATERFAEGARATVVDVDIEGLLAERVRQGSFEDNRRALLRPGADGAPADPADPAVGFRTVRIGRGDLAVPRTDIGLRRAVIGISGGLDSTLALMVAIAAFDLLKLPREGIIGVTMPGFGTSDRTHDNALALMASEGITLREISIRAACEQHFRDIGHDGSPDTTYENAQARERTQILMDLANMEGALVVGTGDLSELALGWCTFNGDHMSMYSVNAGVPKTLVGAVVQWLARRTKRPETRRALLDIAETPISPELLPPSPDGAHTQQTERTLGPYELHDFFLYRFMRFGDAPRRMLFLAEQAFGGRYTRVELLGVLRTFLRRFFAQQFKRNCMPDGPAIGSISLSPRGAWQMPSDASSALWLRAVEEMEKAMKEGEK